MGRDSICDDLCDIPLPVEREAASGAFGGGRSGHRSLQMLLGDRVRYVDVDTHGEKLGDWCRVMRNQ